MPDLDRPRLVTIVAFEAWTVLVWVGRIRNVLTDDDLSDTGRLVRTVIAVLFVGAAVVVGGQLVRVVRERPASDRAWRSLQAAMFFLVWLTVVVWVVRGAGIVVDADHDAAFKMVHSALALVTIGLALAARRAVRPVAEIGQSSPS